MNDQQMQNLLTQYQEDFTLADMSGQAESFIKEMTGISTEEIAGVVDAIGETLASSVVSEMAKEDGATTYAELEEWEQENITSLVRQSLTRVGQQVGSHCLLFGCFLTRALLTEKAKHE